VSDVADALPKDQPLAYSSVLTTLRILEQKGYVKHKQSGRAFVYHPVVDRTQARRSAVRHLLGRLFDGSPQLLMQSLLEDKTLTAAERRRLRGLIQRMD
jgi:predicted transcriptional regulator